MAAVVKALPGRYAKFLTAAAGIGIVYAQNQFGASNQWVQLAVAIAAALGVLAVPNSPAAPAAPTAILPTLPINKDYEAALRAALANIEPAPGSAPPVSVTPPPVT